MKIILLGHKGNLGHQLSRLIRQDERFSLLELESEDVFKDGRLDPLGHIETFFPQIIINTIAYNAVDKCENDQAEFALAESLNVALPAALAKLCQRLGARLVHYSTDYVFGDYAGKDLDSIIEQGGFDENASPRPGNRYAQSKLAGELVLLQSERDGLDFLLIRTSKLFGPKGSSSFAKDSFFDIMLGLAKKGQELKVVDAEKSCFTYTPDLAKGTIKLIVDQAPAGIYHLVNEGEATWYEGVRTLLEITKQSNSLIALKPEDYPRPAKRPDYSVLKNSKLEKLRHYREALSEYLRI